MEGKLLETVLVKKPEDGEILELVDVECTYPEAGSTECTAPPGYRCPYRRYAKPLRSARDEMLSRFESGLSQSRPLRLTQKRE